MQRNVIKTQNYNIHIGSGVGHDIANIIDISKYSKVFYITDANVMEIMYTFIDLNSLNVQMEDGVVIGLGETAKYLDNMKKIWRKMMNANLNRKSLVLNIGGGIVTDIGGFAASTFMRGIDFINIPTTLLAQVDASVGGKNGINFDGIKNLIGSFNEPKAVLIDEDSLFSLSKRQIVNGLCESLKHHIIDNQDGLKDFFGNLHKYVKLKGLHQVIVDSCNIKNKIVEMDFQEQTGIRQYLNFGHTVGHAIESYCAENALDILHGEAILIGMAIETIIGKKMNLINDTFCDEVLLSIMELCKYIDFNVLKSVTCEVITPYMNLDKKNESEKIKIIVPQKTLHPIMVEIADINIVTEAFNEMIKRINL